MNLSGSLQNWLAFLSHPKTDGIDDVDKIVAQLLEGQIESIEVPTQEEFEHLCYVYQEQVVRAPASLDEIERAVSLPFWGACLSLCHPMLTLPLLKAFKARGFSISTLTFEQLGVEHSHKQELFTGHTGLSKKWDIEEIWALLDYGIQSTPTDLFELFKATLNVEKDKMEVSDEMMETLLRHWENSACNRFYLSDCFVKACFERTYNDDDEMDFFDDLNREYNEKFYNQDDDDDDDEWPTVKQDNQEELPQESRWSKHLKTIWEKEATLYQLDIQDPPVRWLEIASNHFGSQESEPFIHCVLTMHMDLSAPLSNGKSYLQMVEHKEPKSYPALENAFFEARLRKAEKEPTRKLRI